MATLNYSSTRKNIDSTLDGVVVVKALELAPIGGCVLDVSDSSYNDIDVLKAGLLIIKKSNGDYAPMPLSGSSYGSLPASASYAGILYASVLKSDPICTLVVRGAINEEACPYEIPSEAKSALSLIRFVKE